MWVGMFTEARKVQDLLELELQTVVRQPCCLSTPRKITFFNACLPSDIRAPFSIPPSENQHYLLSSLPVYITHFLSFGPHAPAALKSTNSLCISPTMKPAVRCFNSSLEFIPMLKAHSFWGLQTLTSSWFSFSLDTSQYSLWNLTVLLDLTAFCPPPHPII